MAIVRILGTLRVHPALRLYSTSRAGGSQPRRKSIGRKSGRAHVGARRPTPRVFVAALCLAHLSLSSGSPSEATRERGPWLKVAVEASPMGWDPHVDFDLTAREHWEQIYETLVQLGPDLAVEPALAESWDRPDPRTYVFHLRRGVLFHHRREMVAGDVVYSFERARRLGAGAPGRALEGMQSVEAVDPAAVRVVLSAPNAGFLSALAANRGAAIVPRDVVERHGSLKAVMVGTGPFRIKKYEPGFYAELERNPSYWGKNLPRVDGIVFVVTRDESARVADLRRGALDIASVRDARLADGAMADKSLRVASPPPAQVIAMAFNQERPPFATRKLRQALSAALDRDALVKAAAGGHGELTAALPPASPFALSRGDVARLAFYRRDPALSRRLLAEGGQPRGFDFTALVVDRPDLLEIARTVQAQLKEVDVRMGIQTVDAPTQANRRRAGDFQAVLTAGDWSPDPDGYVRAEAAAPKDGERHRTANPELERALEDSRVAIDTARRAELWRRIQGLLAEEVPAVWLLARPAGFDLVRAAVTGYVPRPDLSRGTLKYAGLAK